MSKRRPGIFERSAVLPQGLDCTILGTERVVRLKPSHRAIDPDKLNLDKQGLLHFPLLEGEENLNPLEFAHIII